MNDPKSSTDLWIEGTLSQATLTLALRPPESVAVERYDIVLMTIRVKTQKQLWSVTVGECERRVTPFHARLDPPLESGDWFRLQVRASGADLNLPAAELNGVFPPPLAVFAVALDNVQTDGARGASLAVGYRAPDVGAVIPYRAFSIHTTARQIFAPAGSTRVSVDFPETPDADLQDTLWTHPEFSVSSASGELLGRGPASPKLELIAAAPEELRAFYDEYADELQFAWTQPSGYGVSGYIIELAPQCAAPLVLRPKGTAPSGDNVIAVPAASVAGFSAEETYTVRMRAVGGPQAPVANQYAPIVHGPWSESAPLLSPYSDGPLLTELTLANSSTDAGQYRIDAVWDDALDREHVAQYELQVFVYTEAGAPGAVKTSALFAADIENQTQSGSADGVSISSAEICGVRVRAYFGQVAGAWGPAVPLLQSVPAGLRLDYYEPNGTLVLAAHWSNPADGFSSELEWTGLDPDDPASSTVTSAPEDATECDAPAPPLAGAHCSARIRAFDTYAAADASVARYGAWSESSRAPFYDLAAAYYDAGDRLQNLVATGASVALGSDARDNLVQISLTESTHE